jgi:glutathione S-transferase
MYHLTALVTCLTIAFYVFVGMQVSRARARRAYGVKLPATTGNPDFERVYRVHMNTLEWLPIFLPSLWLFATYIGDTSAAALGLVWIIGRILYMIGYLKAVEKRGPGFAIQGLACVVLWAGSLGAIVWRLVHA